MKYAGSRVRRFLVIIEMIPAAVQSDPLRIVDTQSPARRVERVNAVVGQFTAAPMPAPMPIVMNEVVHVWPLWRGSLPHQVIQVCRNRHWLAMANRSPRTGVDCAGIKNLANHALTHLLHRLDQCRKTAPLVPHLHHALVLARR